LLVPRYHCRGAHINHGEAWCISFGGLRPDQAVSREILRALEGKAIEAALQAAADATAQQEEKRRALALELEEANYQAKLAARRYEAVDPEKRLVAAELEARWNEALEKVEDVKVRLFAVDREPAGVSDIDRESLLALAERLPSVWNSPDASMRLKQRIVRILIQEIVADIDEAAHEIVLIIHWAGGRHSELRVKKNRTGHHRRCTESDAIEVVRRMGGRWPDENVAATLNRLGFRTGAGNAWTEVRVRTLRQRLGITMMPQGKPSGLTLEQAAARLGVSPSVVRRLIKERVITASQAVPSAPWEIAPAVLESRKVKEAVRAAKERTSPRTRASRQTNLMIPGL
jgi:hypothetical protein